MNVLEILCHPQPGSFNHVLADRAHQTLNRLGHKVVFHDLYQEGFDPVLRPPELSRGYSLEEQVQDYCGELTAAQGLVIFHPDWWGQPPALLKGWVDRVFRQGVAYDLEGDEFVEKRWVPLLRGKKAIVFCTSDSPLSDDVHVLQTLWNRLILGYCGMSAECHMMREVRKAEPARKKEWIDSVETTLTRWLPGEAEAAIS